MKKSSKLLALFVVLSVIVSLVCLPISAVDVEQGRTTNQTFVFDDVAGVSGVITYSNPDMIASVTARTNATGEVSKDAFFLYSDEAEEGRFSFTLSIKVSPKAKANETCVITLTYDIFNEKGEEIQSNLVKTVAIKAVPATSNADYSKLEEQIALAEVLVEKDYTPASWAAFEVAFANAMSARTSTNQNTIDAAADALEAARLALIKLDYSKLAAALAEVDAYYETNELTNILKQFVEAVMLGNELLENGGDQEDLDATAAKILELLDALKKALSEVGETEYVEVPVEKEVIVEKEVVVEKEVEKIVEVQNNLWLVLFIITAVLLVAAVAVLVVLFVKKKNTEKDMMSAPGNIED